MSVVINTNSTATVAANNLSAANSMLQRSISRLSTGSKITHSADDSGGLAVSMKLAAAARRQGAVSSAIGNAIFRAVGARVRDLPIRAEAVKAAMKT